MIRKSSLFIVFVLLLSAGCLEPIGYEGTEDYSDGFESYTSFEDIDEDDRFFFQLTYPENIISIDTTRPYAGNQCLRFFGKGEVDDVLSKCSMMQRRLALREGKIVTASGWFYLDSNATLASLYLLDMEERTPIGAGPGMRVLIDEANELQLNHKFPNPTLRQDSTTARQVPRKTWFKITLESLLSQKEDGWVKVYQNDTLVIEQYDWQTLPVDLLYFQQGTKGVYSSIEFGVTANSSPEDVTVFVDEIEVFTR
jgi:hypothetical protein